MNRKIKNISDLTTMEKELIYCYYFAENNKDVIELIKTIARNELKPEIEQRSKVIWNLLIFFENAHRHIILHEEKADALSIIDDTNEEISHMSDTKKSWEFTVKCLSLKKVGLIENLDSDERHVDTASFRLKKDYIQQINKMLSKYMTVFNNLPDKHVKNIDSIIEKYKKDFELSDSDYDSNKITLNKEKLIDYMKNIVDLDSDIFSLKRRYNSLAKEREHLIMYDYFDEFVNANCEIENKVSELKKNIKALNNKIENKPTLKNNINIDLPKKPMFNLTKPEEPVLKKANLFNKKKVEEENKQLLQQFNKDMSVYNKELEKYNNDIDNYDKEVEKIKEEAKKQNEKLYEEELEEYENKVKDDKMMLEKKDAELHNLLDNEPKELEEILLDKEGYKKLKAIEYELEFIIENIKKDIEIQNKMYSYNIIYGKYRNYIAMSSFIDYFMSGRCSTLDTNTGAYNLYEQESRTDIIINKLDAIVDSLEEIKENQYYIYNQLKSINNTLENIDSQLLVNNILQVVQVAKLDEIIDNTNEIAYNTKVTAYYSKKTANYTKAIAFMNFMDRV